MNFLEKVMELQKLFSRPEYRLELRGCFECTQMITVSSLLLLSLLPLCPPLLTLSSLPACPPYPLLFLLLFSPHLLLFLYPSHSLNLLSPSVAPLFVFSSSFSLFFSSPSHLFVSTYWNNSLIEPYDV